MPETHITRPWGGTAWRSQMDKNIASGTIMTIFGSFSFNDISLVFKSYNSRLNQSLLLDGTNVLTYDHDCAVLMFDGRVLEKNVRLAIK